MVVIGEKCRMIFDDCLWFRGGFYVSGVLGWKSVSEKIPYQSRSNIFLLEFLLKK